ETAHLGLAAALIGDGKPRDALADLDAAGNDPKYAPLIAGLRAQAHAQAGDFAAARDAEEKRRDLLAARYEKTRADEDALDLALSEAQMAQWSWRLKDSTN